MNFILLVVGVLFLSSLRVRTDDGWAQQYISKEHSTTINGIFVILVFLSHVQKTTLLNGKYDDIYIFFRDHLDQMVVVMFLFYSGYGITEQIKIKGYPYVTQIPQKRLLRVFVNFVIAVFLFLGVDFCLNQRPKISTFLLALIGWESIGNSNWYMCVIFCLYIIVFLSFIILKWGNNTLKLVISASISSVMAILLIIFFMKNGKGTFVL